MSAKLRGLGAGATMRFGDVEIEIAAVLPDELVGAHELLVSRETGLRIGVTHDRYALLVPRGEPDARELTRDIRERLPDRHARPGARARGHAVLPSRRRGAAARRDQAPVRRVRGEAASGPTRVPHRGPRLGRGRTSTRGGCRSSGPMTCNVALFPQLEGAMRDLPGSRARADDRHVLGVLLGEAHQPHPDGRALAPFVGHRDRCQRAENPFGAEPDQDPRLVRVMERWGFTWGGDWVLPDGMHFEYRRPPTG